MSLLAASFSLFAATNSERSNDVPSLLPPHAEIPPTFPEQHDLPLPAGTDSETTNAIPPPLQPREEVLLPLHAEIPPTFWEQHGWTIMMSGVALIVLTGAGVWFLRRPKPVAVPPPEVQARRALEALVRQTEDGAVLSRVSRVLRQYVAAAFNLSPDELTTAEFCHVLDSQEQIGPELSSALADFLHRCDERKFAPSVSLAEPGAAAQALVLVELAEARRARLQQAAAANAAVEPVRTA